MPRRRVGAAGPTELLGLLGAQLDAFGARYDGLDLRGRVRLLADILTRTRELNVAVAIASGCGASGARERIRLYLVQYVELPIDGIELEVVSGISEYARRVRELRVQDGYRIVTGNTLSSRVQDPDWPDLRPYQYLLLRPDPDREAAFRWNLANRIRREGGAAKDRIRKYLLQNVGVVVTAEELDYVADISEWARRVRELRTEEGYAVATKYTGRPDLKPGEYVLESADRIAEPHDRKIPTEVQREVYERDANRCRICGGTIGHWMRPGSWILELHHIEEHARGGSNRAGNLMVLCNACHDDVHAGRIELPPRIGDGLC